MKAKPKLTLKQQRFVENYLKTGNAMQAAIDAGYSHGTAGEMGYENLNKPQIKELIDNKRLQMAERAEVKIDDVGKEYKKLAFSNFQDFMKKDFNLEDIINLPRDVAAAISEVTVDEKVIGGKVVRKAKIKLHSKTQALEALGKHFGFFEKDNKQKQSTDNQIDYSKLTDEQLRVLATLPRTGNQGTS